MSLPCCLQWHIDPKEIEFTDRLGTGTSAQVYKGTKALLPFQTLLAPPPFRKAKPSFFASFFLYLLFTFIINGYYLPFMRGRAVQGEGGRHQDIEGKYRGPTHLTLLLLLLLLADPSPALVGGI